jgi:hypothetical protein
MNTDKIFYATWGAVIIMIGICVLLGMYLNLEIIGTTLLWLFSVGIILLTVGIATVGKDKNTATLQMITGMILSSVTIGGLVLIKNLLDVYQTLAIILIIVGVSIVAIGLSRKR